MYGLTDFKQLLIEAVLDSDVNRNEISVNHHYIQLTSGINSYFFALPES